MAEKKNQHLVPACYLKGFEAIPTDEMLKNPKFETGVYVNNNFLNIGWKLRGIRHGVFTKSYYYNLDSDDPRQPIIESYLSIVEGDLSKYLKEVQAGVVTNENLSFLSFYTTLQYIRVENFIDMFQGAWNQVAEWADMFEGGNSYREAVKDIAKKQILTTDLGEIVHGDAHIVYNETNFPFITSDNPVLRKEVNICDMEVLFPKVYLISAQDQAQEYPLFFFTLSPNMAYVSSPFFKKGLELKLNLNDLLNIFYLNVESVKNACNRVYSSVFEPIKGESQLSDYLVSLKSEHLFVKIYGKGRRFISRASYNNTENYNSIELYVDDSDGLRHFECGDMISLVEIIENGASIRGMRECRIEKVHYELGFVRIVSNFKLNI